MPREFRIAKQVVLEATPEQVWQTIATEAGLAAWFQPSPIDPGSDLIVGWEPGRRLAIRTAPAPGGSTHASHVDAEEISQAWDAWLGEAFGTGQH